MDIINLKKLEVAYAFNYDINRVWYVVKDHCIWAKLIGDQVSDYEFQVGNDTYTVGNEFSCTWYGVSETHTKCVQIDEDTDNYKFASWKVNILNIEVQYYMNFYLYADTFDKSTVIIWEISMEDSEKVPIIDEMIQGYKNSIAEIFERISENFEKVSSTQNVSQYESIFINAEQDKVWDLMTNWKQLKTICPLIANDVEYDGENVKLGTKLKLTLKKNKCTSVCFLQTTSVSSSPNDYKWGYTLTCYDAIPKVPKQEIVFNVIKVNEQNTFLTFTHDFKEFINNEVLNFLSNDKKEILKCLKVFLES